MNHTPCCRRRLPLAAALLALIAAGGCEEKTSQKSDEQLASVRIERDKYLAQRDDYKGKVQALQEQLKNSREAAEAAVTQERQALADKLDEIRRMINEALAADGRVASLADSGEVVKLTGELISQFHDLRQVNRSLEAKCQAMTASLAPANRPPSIAPLDPATQPDSAATPRQPLP